MCRFIRTYLSNSPPPNGDIMKFREACILCISLVFAVFIGLAFYETMLKVDDLQDEMIKLREKMADLRVQMADLMAEARPLISFYDTGTTVILNGEEVPIVPEQDWKEKP